MTPTLDADSISPHPTAVPSHAAARSDRTGRRMLGAGLGLGLLAEWAFDGHTLGLSVPLFAMALAWCALAALATWAGDTKPQAWSLMAVFTRPFAAGARTLPAGARVVSSTVKLGGVKSALDEWAWPVVRSAVLVVLVVLLVLSGLLMSADATFSRRVVAVLAAVQPTRCWRANRSP